MTGVDDLSAYDVRQRRRLAALANDRRGEREPLSAQDLGFVLHDVLVDGFRSDRKVKAGYEKAWQRLEPLVESRLRRESFDRELFLLGAYASVVGVELALPDPARTAVIEAFLATGKGTLRLRRSRPGRWHIERAIVRYREAAPAGGGSFLHAARLFAERCAPVDAGLADEAMAALGRAGLEAFYDHAAGTVNAAVTWEVVVPELG